MSSSVHLKKLVQTCVAMPSQWDGWTENGRYLYIRYRHGKLSANFDDVFGPPLHASQPGNPLDGFMGTSEMLQRVGLSLTDDADVQIYEDCV